MSQVIIRKAVPADLEAVGALFIELDEHHVRRRPDEFLRLDGPARTPAMIAEILAANDAAVFVAEDPASGDLIGLAHVFRRAFPQTIVTPGRIVGALDSLVVSSRSRRGGVGARLICEAERWVREQGLDGLELSVREFNEAGLSFYATLGFEGMSRRLRWPAGALMRR